jgi:hypothetical protein
LARQTGFRAFVIENIRPGELPRRCEAQRRPPRALPAIPPRASPAAEIPETGIWGRKEKMGRPLWNSNESPHEQGHRILIVGKEVLQSEAPVEGHQ